MWIFYERPEHGEFAALIGRYWLAISDTMVADMMGITVGKVSEMKAEYFPPREDIILLNEAPSEFYIVVNGSAVSWSLPGLSKNLLLDCLFHAGVVMTSL